MASAFASAIPLTVRLPQPAVCREPPRRFGASNTRSSLLPTEDSDVDDQSIDTSWRMYTRPGNVCVLCNGHGNVKCLYCFGEGVIRIGPDPVRDSIKCPQCNGTGLETCARCEGTGIRPTTRVDVLSGETVRNLTNEEVCEGKGILDINVGLEERRAETVERRLRREEEIVKELEKTV